MVYLSNVRWREVMKNNLARPDWVEAARKIEAGEAEEKVRAAAGHREENPARRAKDRLKFSNLHQNRATKIAARTDITNLNTAD